MNWAGFWFLVSEVLFLLWLLNRGDANGERARADSLQSDVDDARATINELETERDILRSSVELERTRADANYEKVKELEADLKAAQFKLRMVRRALDHDKEPVVGIDAETGNIIRSGDLVVNG